MVNDIDIGIDGIVNLFDSFCDKSLDGLMIKHSDIIPIVDSMRANKIFDIIELGKSLEGLSIYGIKFGSGKHRIFIYSQMHGNESTGTKVIFDIINLFSKKYQDSDIISNIISSVTIYFLPMLNPDGANIYCRFNSQNIDINRDAVSLQSPESKILLRAVDGFDPKFIFNLHDQRRIFNIKNSRHPAGLSLLAPNVSKEGVIVDNMRDAMGLIGYTSNIMKNYFPNIISRFSDEYYPTSTGENFQKKGYSTILIEAGNALDDYNKNIIRKYKFVYILKSIISISKGIDYKKYFDNYFDIPNSDKKMLDVIVKNVKILKNDHWAIVDLGIVKYDKFCDGRLIQEAYIELIGDLSNYYPYKLIDGDGRLFKSGKSHIPKLNMKAKFNIGEDSLQL